MDKDQKVCMNCDNWYNIWDDGNCGSCDKLTEQWNETKNFNQCRCYPDSMPLTTEKYFGCIHFKRKE